MKKCKRFGNSSFENYICETKTQEELVNALKNGSEKGFNNNIIIIGGVGTGKTHLAFSLLNSIAETWVSPSTNEIYYGEKKVAYRTIKEIIDGIRNSWNDRESPNPIYDLIDVPLLIIDEIGIQYGTDSERTELYELFNKRYEDMLPTIAISNFDIPALQKTLGQRIFDRLSGGASIYKIEGKSKR